MENINEKNSNDNKNEQFILGNQTNNDKNVLQSSGDYNTPRKKINTIMDTLQISESLVIKAQPKINESQQIKDFVNDKRHGIGMVLSHGRIACSGNFIEDYFESGKIQLENKHCQKISLN